MTDLLKALREHWEQKRGYHLIGFDVKLRLCWWWPFFRCSFGCVHKLDGIPARKALRSGLAP
jgi:hypothetical protein